MKMQKASLALALAVALWPLGPARAADFHVTTAQELQTALATAQSNGTNDKVFLAAGTYAGIFTFVSSEANDLEIRAEAGLNPGQVVLDGQSLGRTLLLQGGGNPVGFTLDNITLQNGSGGGVKIDQTTSAVAIRNCIVRNNVQNEGQGGGLGLFTTGSATVTGTTITGNTGAGSYFYGGGAFINSGTVVFTDNTILNNSVSGYEAQGGGVKLQAAGSVVFADNVVTGNSTAGAYGGVSLSGSESILLTGNTISANSSSYFSGVGIGGGSGTVTITGNAFTNNAAGSYYGALYIAGTAAAITFSDNTVTGNTAYGYAGIHFAQAPSITFAGNTISRNKAAGNNGALYISATTVAMARNTIAENESNYSHGAGEVNATGSLMFDGNTIHKNKTNSGSYGGIQFTGTPATAVVVNNVVAGNSAAGSNGGISIGACTTLDLVNNTMTGNSAGGSVGAVGLDVPAGTTLNAYNNIIWGNTAPLGGDISLTSSGGTRNGYHNDYSSFSGLWSFAGSNNDVAPSFVNAAAGDYHLTAASALLIDGGENAPPDGLPATDRDGNPRIADGTVDLGAYEHTTTDFHPADTDSDWVISSAEASAYGDAWRNGGTWTAGPVPIPIDYATRAGYLAVSGSPAGTYKNTGGGKPLCWIPVP